MRLNLCFLILCSLWIGLRGSKELPECRISNGKYTKWFITSERNTNGRDRSVGINRFSLFAEPDQDVWQFIPVNGTVKNAYILRNMKFKDNLYATQEFSGMNPLNLRKRRNIRAAADKAMTKSDIPRDAFVWIFKPLDAKDPKHLYILNKHYKEPLYAGSWVIFKLAVTVTVLIQHF